MQKRYSEVHHCFLNNNQETLYQEALGITLFILQNNPMRRVLFSLFHMLTMIVSVHLWWSCQEASDLTPEFSDVKIIPCLYIHPLFHTYAKFPLCVKFSFSLYPSWRVFWTTELQGTQVRLTHPKLIQSSEYRPNPNQYKQAECDHEFRGSDTTSSLKQTGSSSLYPQSPFSLGHSGAFLSPRILYISHVVWIIFWSKWNLAETSCVTLPCLPFQLHAFLLYTSGFYPLSYFSQPLPLATVGYLPMHQTLTSQISVRHCPQLYNVFPCQLIIKSLSFLLHKA